MTNSEFLELKELHNKLLTELTSFDYIQNPKELDTLFTECEDQIQGYWLISGDPLEEPAIAMFNELIIHFYTISGYQSKAVEDMVLRYSYEDTLLKCPNILNNDPLRVAFLKCWSTLLIGTVLNEPTHLFWDVYSEHEYISCIPKLVQELHIVDGQDADELGIYLDKIYNQLSTNIRNGYVFNRSDCLNIGYILTLDKNNTHHTMFEKYKDIVKEHVDINKITTYNNMMKTLGLTHTTKQWFDAMGTEITELNLPEFK